MVKARSAPVLLVALALLASAPADPQAAPPMAPSVVTLPAGMIVGPQDLDMTPLLTAAGIAPLLCAMDDDGDAAYDPGEFLYVDIDGGGCPAGTEGNDVRLTPSGDKPPGSRIRIGDGDYNNPGILAPADLLLFFDANGNGAFDRLDTMYADIIAGGGPAVHVGDLRLTAYGNHLPGTVAEGAAADLNLPLAAFALPLAVSVPNTLAYHDIDGDGVFSQLDALYVDQDGPAIIPLLGFDVAVTQDVRLTPFGPYPFGTPVGALDFDRAAPYRVPGVPGAIIGNLCFLDDDTDGAYDTDEPLYFDVDAACATGVEGNDLRLVPNAGKPAGSLVARADSDFNAPLTAGISEALAFYDKDGNGVFNAGDALYVDINNVPASTVDVGDYRFTPSADMQPMSVVRNGNADLNLPLVALGGFVTSSPNVLAFLDAQNDGVFNEGDIAYLNTDAGAFPEFVQPNDVRLTSLLGLLPAGSVTSAMDPDVTPAYAAGALAPNPCVIDDDGDGAYDPGEALVLDVDAACATPTEANDLRLTANNGKAAGSKIRSSDADYNSPVAGPVADLIRFFDENGNGAFDLQDTLYLDLANGPTFKVDVGDLRLTARSAALPAFSVVQVGDADGNNGIVDFPAAQGGPRGFSTAGSVGFWDVDADLAYSRPDSLYLSRFLGAAAGSVVLIGDVRLTSAQVLSLAPPGSLSPPPPGGSQGGAAPPGGVQQQLENLLQLNADLSAQLNRSLTQNAQLQGQVSNLSATLGGQTAQLTALQTQLGGLQQENTRLNAELQRAGGRDAPGFGVLLLAAGLGAALLVLRRRP